MSFKNRVERLEAQAKLRVGTLAGAIGGCLVDGFSKPGLLILPDGRELTEREFDELAARYHGAGGPVVLILDA